jgi:4-amino-4-deoxy-L-arabinose transferase-like glycosyltransferase
MQTNWRVWLRKTHLYLGVFFSPLLLFFILTGCWQTVVSDQEHTRHASFFHNLMSRLSTVHTEDYYPHGAAGNHSQLAMKVLVVALVVALVLSIILGLWLAWIAPKGKWLALLAFLLGILVPVVILYLG